MYCEMSSSVYLEYRNHTGCPKQIPFVIFVDWSALDCVLTFAASPRGEFGRGSQVRLDHSLQLTRILKGTFFGQPVH